MVKSDLHVEQTSFITRGVTSSQYLNAALIASLKIFV
jgi:hypothetical protein